MVGGVGEDIANARYVTVVCVREREIQTEFSRTSVAAAMSVNITRPWSTGPAAGRRYCAVLPDCIAKLTFYINTILRLK